MQVPIKSFITDQLTLAIGKRSPCETCIPSKLTWTKGQRYDVVINANQTVGNYWFRVSLGTACTTNSIVGTGVQLGAVLHYSGAPDANPTSTTNVTMRTACNDESTSNLIPYVSNTVPSSVVGTAGKMNLSNSQDPAQNNLFRWLIDGTPLVVDWNKPTLGTVLAGSSDFGPNENIHQDPTSGWYLWYIQSVATVLLPHPIHLHGHDYYIVGQGTGTWDGSTTGLNLNNPTRRDTATLPAGGYLLMAFPADNPGMWIMHCHIAWHASQGLALQFMERQSEIVGAIGDTTDFKNGCSEWDDYWVNGNPNKPYNQTDSGI